MVNNLYSINRETIREPLYYMRNFTILGYVIHPFTDLTKKICYHCGNVSLFLCDLSSIKGNYFIYDSVTSL